MASTYVARLEGSWKESANEWLETLPTMLEQPSLRTWARNTREARMRARERARILAVRVHTHSPNSPVQWAVS
jgi:hypothetical protein